jgi:replicative DNA helicase
MNAEKSVLSPAQVEKMKEIVRDPVKWSQVFVVTYDSVLKKETPWIARWYQSEMLKDTSLKKVYRCGRRTGKTETMILDMLWRIFTRRNYRCLTITPYENQVRLQFQRIRELIDISPLLKAEVVSMTKNPYALTLKNNSSIFGFTTGASSGNGAASVRGQRCDWLYLDEVDYMADADFDSITAIAAERADIGITMSSTPTGKRSQFWKACCIPEMHYSEHWHPSTHNPNWGPTMEAEFRAQLSEQGYVHEVMAEFGTEDTGVFDKDKLDKAMKFELYAYNELDYYQKQRCIDNGLTPNMYLYQKGQRAHPAPWRTIGVDWDKYSASSSIIILEYDLIRKKFKVIKRVEVPRSEYSYDTAVNLIVELNEQYNPAWIYCDRGAGEYQVERLHIIGEEKPHTGLRNKVKGFQFKQSLDMIDPVTFEEVRKPMKPFMVTQLQIAFERENLMLSPFDEVLHKQLIDYCVEKKAANGDPIFTSVNEHFIDALGLAYLAMVLEFQELTDMMKEPETATRVEFVNKTLGTKGLNEMFRDAENSALNYNDSFTPPKYDPTERRGDRPSQFKVGMNYRKRTPSTSWGSRSSGSRLKGGGVNRSSW